MKHISFRVPADVYQDYVLVAQARGVDLSAVLNWILADRRPALLLQHAEYAAAMLRAAVAGVPRSAPPAPDAQQALARVNDLMGQLQDVASRLSAQAKDEEGRQAA